MRRANVTRLTGVPGVTRVARPRGPGGRVALPTTHCRYTRHSIHSTYSFRMLPLPTTHCCHFVRAVASGVAAGVAAVVGIRSSLSDADLRAKGAAVSVEDWREVHVSLLNSLLA